jgi:uncharacterized membrane protein HdeD (DUF308 family)
MTPLGERAVSAEREVQQSAGWWIALIAGFLTIVAGIVVLRVNWTVSGLAAFLGIVFIVRGLADALSPPLDGGPRAPRMVAGLLEAGVGIALIAWPGPGLTVIATFFGCWLVIGGMLEIVGSLGNRERPLWWLVLLLGIAMVVLGVWALQRPAATLSLLIALTGVWAIVAGTLEIVFAFELRRVHKLALAREGAVESRVTRSAAA